jgi:hypothetical protein
MVLISLDGWGLSSRTEGNAIAASRPERMLALAREYPSTQLEASGLAVGLPAGQMGNSEVGHMCMGAGRTVLQDLLRITKAVESGELASNPVLAPLMDSLARSGGALHLMGLTSDGGVHSHIDHARGLARMARDRSVRRIHHHAFLDGRDTAPRCAEKYLADLESAFRAGIPGGIATVIGRYYAMGAHRASVPRPDGGRGAARARCPLRPARRLRARRRGRVRPAHGDRARRRRAGGAGAGRRRDRLLQLPGRQGPPAHAGLHAGEFRASPAMSA